MADLEGVESPRIGPRGIAALRASRPWASLVGVIAFILAAIGIIDAFVYSLVGFPNLPAGTEPRTASLLAGFATLSAIIGAVIYGFSGWFALQYGRRLKAGLDATNPQELETALWWQRRYWTLQGILMIVLIVATVLVFFAAIIGGLLLAAHRGGLGA